MYDHDDDDIGNLIADTPHRGLNEDESAQTIQRDVTLSNPWTIAKMNSPIKPSQRPCGFIESSTPLSEQSAHEFDVTPNVRPRSTEQNVVVPFSSTPTEAPIARSGIWHSAVSDTRDS
ncbi:hypothetical protein K490DRAFT_58559 [Saccharata proteae CBS 121410]|uniref:Uncharacterized protein n=1 Tax=Saccharata proteae CBS 121410 TaxID=1314787 RepID=A0A9P4HPV2_9PEZI|nr:hypothetical protein K490DRAFT_58559 [Saccharata proteae CBS 121410]